jgi:hypothetical protein
MKTGLSARLDPPLEVSAAQIHSSRSASYPRTKKHNSCFFGKIVLVHPLRGILKAEGQWKRLAEDVNRLPKRKGSPGRSLSPEESLRLFTTAESKENWFVAYHAMFIAGMRSVELRNLKLTSTWTPRR